MKKKLSVILLIMSLIMGSMPVMAAEDFDISDTEFAQDIDLIVNLGLASGYEGIYDIYSKITRAEFISLVSNLITDDNMAVSNVFKDVDENAGYAFAVAKMYARGYISNDGSGRFRPDEYIKYEEAVKIIMSMAGYDYYAQANGGYPAGYLKTASENGLLNGIKAEDGYLTSGMAVKLFSGALNVNIVEYTGAGNQQKVNRDKTLLSSLAGIKYIKGRLTATKDINLDGGKPVSDGQILFGGYLFETYDYDSYLGYTGKCYYRKNNMYEGQYDVLYIQPDKRKNKNLRVNAQDFVSCKDYSYSYMDGEKTKDIRMGMDTVFIYNGRIADEFSADIMDIEYGYIDFLDSDGDGRYDLVNINEYYNTVVENVIDEKIYDKYNQNRHIDMKEYGEVRIYNEAGKSIGKDSIAAGTVLSVFKNLSEDNKELIKITVSSKSVTGTVTGTMTKYGNNYVTINDAEYELYSDYRSVLKNKIDVEDSGTYLMDYTGLIVTVTNASNDSFRPAYFVNVLNGTDEPGEYKPELKAYIADVGFGKYPVNEKRVTVDGVLYKDTQYKELYNYLNANKCEVAMIKLDADGRVFAVDTVNSNAVSGGSESSYNAADRLKRGSALTGARYKTDTMIFEGKCAIDPDTKVFVIPSNPLNAEDSEFMVSDSKYFTNDTPYDFTPYYLSGDKLTSDIIVLKGSTTTVGSSSSIGMVRDVFTVYSEEAGDVVETYAVNVFGANEEWQTNGHGVSEQLYRMSIGSSNGTDTLEELGYDHEITRGDIIKCAFDDRGYINKIVLIVDGRTNEVVSVNPSVEDFHPPGYRYVMGTVNRKYGNVVELLRPDGSMEYHNIGITPIMAVDDKFLQSETIGGIRENDTVFIVNRGGNTVYTFLYRAEG